MSYFSYDYYDNIKQNKLFLANPQKNYIGQLSGVRELSFTEKKFDISEFSFKIYSEEDSIQNKLYEKIKRERLIELENIGWFIITDETEHCDSDNAYYKEVTCNSLEHELTSRKIYAIKGVYKLYDVTDQEHSLLHLVSSSCNWTIKDVDSDLAIKWRNFDIDEDKIYSFLMETVSDSYDCVFLFDTYSRTISVKKLDDIGEKTNIILSRKNIVDDFVKEYDGDIITKMVVKGNDDVDIRSVNPTGTNYIVNFDYFKNTDWMSQGLIDALNKYEVAYRSYQAEYSNAINSKKALYEQYIILESELATLELTLSALEDTRATNVTAGYSSSESLVNQIDELTNQIVIKKSEISNKDSELTVIENKLSSIGSSLNMNLHFTREQLLELEAFIKEGDDYIDETFVASDEMTENEIMEMKLELYEKGEKELARLSHPQFTISADLNNLFTMQDNEATFGCYKEWRNKFVVGNIVTVIMNNYTTTARIMEMTYDFENKEKISVVISDRSRFDNTFSELGSILSDAKNYSRSYSLNKYGYNKAKDMTSQVNDFINGSLDASQNNIYNNPNQEMLINTYGAWFRKWLPNENRFDDCQSFWSANNLLFTNTSWKSTPKVGIGNFSDSEGNLYYGVLADVICGKLILGSQLTITNSSGNFTIDNNGWSATNGNYSVNINPSTPSKIFNIKVNGTDSLYIDTVNNKLVFNGELQGASGTFSGELKASTGTFSGTVSGGSININDRFKVDSLGNVTLPSNATISWSQVTNQPYIPTLPYYIQSTKITSTTIESPIITGSVINGGEINGAIINSFESSTSRLTKIESGLIQTTEIELYETIGGGFSTGGGGCNLTYSGIDVFSKGGTTCIRPNEITINGYSVITTNNISYYTSGFATSGHSHSEYVTYSSYQSSITSLAQRISALESKG